MKKTKRFASLFLAMLMVFSLMAVTASAYSAEEHAHACYADTIQPRKPAAQCTYCGQGMTQTGSGKEEDGRHYILLTCTNPDCTNHDSAKIYW